jgi:3-oxoacyl-[acyl-carrier protein] reductase
MMVPYRMDEDTTSSLLGKTALVTGAGIGIGRAIAIGLASAGARVAITYRTHTPDDDLLNCLRSQTGFDPPAIRLDATSEQEVIEAVEAINTELGSVNILVNNVGGLVERASIGEMSFDLWRAVLAVNLDSMFLMTHHIKRIFHSDGGRIINVASLAGRNGGHAGATAYAASKAAVFGFTRGLATEMAPEGTTVNALAPGFIEETPFHDTFTTDESKAMTIATIPVGRAGLPGDVADAAVWLASPGSSFVSGTIIDINGAQYFG